MSRPYRIRTCDTLIKSQGAFNLNRQNPLDITPPKDLYSYKFLLGGDSNVLTANRLCCLPQINKGGESHGDKGGRS